MECDNNYSYPMSDANRSAQVTFPVSLEQRVVIALGRAFGQLAHGMEQVLKPYGVTPTQYNVLRILNGAGEKGLCGTEDGGRMISKVPDVTRLLDRMVAAGWVERERDQENRRFVTTRITEAGRELLLETTPIIDAMHQNAFKNLSQAQLQAMLDMLEATLGDA